MRLSVALSVVLGLSMSLLAGVGYAERFQAETTPRTPRAPKDLWIISQKTDGGIHYTVCVAKGAVKFVSGNLAILAKEPDWKVSVLNERTKLYWQTALTDFDGLPPVETYDLKKIEPVATEITQTKIAKRAVDLYEGKPEYAPEKAKKMGFTPAKIRIWSCSDVNADTKALEVLSRLYGVSGVKGIPMRVQMETPKGEKIECLSTDWCFDRNLSPLFFDVPKHFKKAGDKAEVLARLTVVTSRSQLKPHDPVSPHLKQVIKDRQMKDGSPSISVPAVKSVVKDKAE
jgi:hypothetical protein